MINIAQETLGLRRTDFSSVLSLLIPAYSLLNAPAALTLDLHNPQLRTLSYHAQLALRIRGFGVMLSPGTFSAQTLLTSELLRTL
jgi:hypothetical protein